MRWPSVVAVVVGIAGGGPSAAAAQWSPALTLRDDGGEVSASAMDAAGGGLIAYTVPSARGERLVAQRFTASGLNGPAQVVDAGARDKVYRVLAAASPTGDLLLAWVRGAPDRQRTVAFTAVAPRGRAFGRPAALPGAVAGRTTPGIALVVGARGRAAVAYVARERGRQPLLLSQRPASGRFARPTVLSSDVTTFHPGYRDAAVKAGSDASGRIWIAWRDTRTRVLTISGTGIASRPRDAGPARDIIALTFPPAGSGPGMLVTTGSRAGAVRHYEIVALARDGRPGPPIAVSTLASSLQPDALAVDTDGAFAVATRLSSPDRPALNLGSLATGTLGPTSALDDTGGMPGVVALDSGLLAAWGRGQDVRSAPITADGVGAPEQVASGAALLQLLGAGDRAAALVSRDRAVQLFVRSH